MKPSFSPQLPDDNQKTRNDLFTGEVYLASTTEACCKLVNEVKQLLSDELDTTDIRHAHMNLSDDAFFASIGKLRRMIYMEEHFHQQVRKIIASLGFDPQRCAFDPLRIRVILPNGHLNEKAAPVYYPHRDTWYAHPQSLIVGWIPLHDLSEAETFQFYPDYFSREVPNNSQIFDYANWIKDGPALKIGWQNKNSGLTANYPRSEPDHNPGTRIGFKCLTGETLLFAGSHYHQTLPQNFDTIRYSLDFRIVHMDDVAASNGAPNTDNRSKGNILKDYIQPQ